VIDWAKPCPSIFGRKRPLAEKTLRRIEIGLRKFVEPFVVELRNNQHGRSAGDPLSTVCTSGAHHALCVTTKNGHSILDPLDTVTTRDRFGVAMVSLIETCQELGIVDIGFRMLDVDELLGAQGFPAEYYLHGTKAEQVKQVGNAVCPPVARALCEAILGA
jgi:DNA (cytosine-5)-methyltransferase 1